MHKIRFSPIRYSPYNARDRYGIVVEVEVTQMCTPDSTGSESDEKEKNKETVHVKEDTVVMRVRAIMCSLCSFS